MFKVNAKTKNIQELNNYMLSKTLGMFDYSGLPESIPKREFEHILQTKGYAFITEVDGVLYAFHGGLGGEQDAYGSPTEITIANSYLNFNKTLNLKDDGVLILNDSMAMGLFRIFERFNTLMVENFITLNLNSFNTRMTRTISASDDRTRESAESYIKKLEEGEQTVIGEHAFFEGVKVHGSAGNSTSSITSLIEYHQYLKASLYNEVGIDLPYNMKRERLNTAEVEQDTDSTLVLVDNLRQCRVEGVAKLNEKYGLSVSVEFSGVWKSEKSIAASGKEVSEDSLDGMDEEGEAEMRTIRQFLDGKNLWEEINKVEEFPFIDDKIDRLFLIEFGSMPLFSGLAEETVEDVADYVVRLFGDKWRSMLDAVGIDLSADSINTVTETIEVDESKTSETSETDQVSAFNSEDLIDDSGRESNATEGREVDTTRTVVDETVSAKTLFDNLQKAEKLNIIKAAMADVANFMKVSVY